QQVAIQGQTTFETRLESLSDPGPLNSELHENTALGLDEGVGDHPRLGECRNHLAAFRDHRWGVSSRDGYRTILLDDLVISTSQLRFRSDNVLLAAYWLASTGQT